MRIGYKVCLLVSGAALVATGVLAWRGYVAARREYIAGVDRQLTAAAAALPRVLGAEYLERALSPAGVPADDYRNTVLLLNDLADESGVYYLYAFAQRDGQIVHLATSASEAERATQAWSAYLEPYVEPPDALLRTFADGDMRFANYTDEFGSFRSIFVGHETPTEARYVVGVDRALSGINRDLRALVWQTLRTGGLVALLTGALGMLAANRLTRPLGELANEVDAWARRDFAQDDAIRERLGSLARTHRDEAGDLAGRFVDVQAKLQTYLQELTETTAAKERVEQQLEIARNIQESLLPREMPSIHNFEVQGWSQPAERTGGDYFDCVPMTDGRVLLTLGDVMGHGIGPAMLATATRAYARAVPTSDAELDASVARINDLLHRDLDGDHFVTLVACLLDPESRQVKLVSAGHGPILVYSKRRDVVDASMDTHGPPLGMTDEVGYTTPRQWTFEPGDVLIMVSDGFFEWANAGKEAFGAERLAASILASCRTAPDQIIERLRRDVATFTGGTLQNDDTTALVVRCVA